MIFYFLSMLILRIKVVWNIYILMLLIILSWGDDGVDL